MQAVLPWVILLSLTAAVPAAAGPGVPGAEPRSPAVLRGEKVAVEAEVREGQLWERYLAIRDGAWIEVATGDRGQTLGPVSMVASDGRPVPGSLLGLSLAGGALIEEIAAGEHRIIRKLTIVGDGTWIRVVTRLEPSGRATLLELSDRLRFSRRPDWSYSPSVGGFNPDAQYKAPLILVQADRVAAGIVPDLTALHREELERCSHALDLDLPGGPTLGVGFVPARQVSHSVYSADRGRPWSAEAAVENAYYLMVTASAPTAQAYRQAVPAHRKRRAPRAGGANRRPGAEGPRPGRGLQVHRGAHPGGRGDDLGRGRRVRGEHQGRVPGVRHVLDGLLAPDYETFWSCSPRKPRLDERTGQWPANDLALGQTVAAYLKAFQLSGEPRDMDMGERLLDYLLLYQQCWTHPALENLSGTAMLLGGFTTQNSDAEWSDARQSQFGNVLVDYYRATGKVEYLERGVAALRAQFPVSPSENWAHEGYGGKAGVSSFHWGTGSGMAGIEIEEDSLRDAVVDVRAGRGVGVNGLNVTECGVQDGEIRLGLASPFAWRRKPVVVFRGTGPGRRYRVVVNGAEIGSWTGEEMEKGIPVAPLSEPLPAER